MNHTTLHPNNIVFAPNPSLSLLQGSSKEEDGCLERRRSEHHCHCYKKKNHYTIVTVATHYTTTTSIQNPYHINTTLLCNISKNIKVSKRTPQ